MKHRYLVLLLSLVVLISGCLPAPHYQKQYGIPQNKWRYDFQPKFKFEITDANAKYRTYFIIQHTEAYPYSNLWMWWYIKTPGDNFIKKERVQVTLAEPTGKWMGRGLGAIYEERILIDLGDSVHLKKPGMYEIVMEQNMRINPLPEILHVGLRIEKISKSNLGGK